MAFRDRIRSIFRRPADPVPAPVPVDRAGVADRRAGALIGVHAGDSLGATFEFNRVGPATIPADQLDVTGGGAFGWNAGDATDDTDLTRAVLHAHLAATEDPDLDIVRVAADNMAAWKAHGPRDIGGATASGLNHYARTGDPRDAGAGQGSAGNGSLMRTIPTAVFVDDPDDRARLSREISAVTHDDLTCQAACVAYNDTVAAVIAGRPVTEAINDATRITTSSVFGDAASSCRNCGEPTELDDSGDRVHTTNSSRICESYRDQYDEEDGDDIDYRHEAGVLDERYDEAVEQVRQAVDAGRSLDLSEVAATGRFPDGYPYSPGGGHVLHSLAVAVAAAEDDRGLEQALSDVVQIGGDADTNGAIAGGLLGARDGASAIPQRWRDKLQYGTEFMDGAAAAGPDQWAQIAGDTRSMPVGHAQQVIPPVGSSGMCGAVTRSSGRPCMNTTTHASGRCPAHR